jgi:hypothetical protein
MILQFLYASDGFKTVKISKIVMTKENLCLCLRTQVPAYHQSNSQKLHYGANVMDTVFAIFANFRQK